MKRLFPLFALFLLLGHPVGAELSLNLQKAVEAYLTNNLLLRAKTAGLAKHEAEIRIAGQRPNPALKAEVESLKNGEQETESTCAISVPLVDRGFRKWSVQAARKARETARLQLDFETSLEIATLKKSYFRVLFLQENLTSLQAVLESFTEFERKNDARFQDGDVAEVELLKLASEKQKVARTMEAAKLEIDLELKNLRLLLNLGSDSLTLAEPFFRPFAALDSREWLALGREHRLDLQSLAAQNSGLIASINAARRETSSPIDLDIGYKNRTGGFNGFVLGVSVPLSWSHRNQAKVQVLQAEAESGRLQREALDRALEATIDGSLDRLRFFRARVEDLQKRLNDLHQISEITAVSYEEGESSLLEMLDSFRAERELLMEKNQANFDYWSAAFEFEATVGVPLPIEGTTQ